MVLIVAYAGWSKWIHKWALIAYTNQKSNRLLGMQCSANNQLLLLVVNLKLSEYIHIVYQMIKYQKTQQMNCH